MYIRNITIGAKLKVPPLVEYKEDMYINNTYLVDIMANIMSFGKRKVWKMNYSRIICLPMTWLRLEGISEGYNVELSLLSDGSLRIRRGEY